MCGEKRESCVVLHIAPRLDRWQAVTEGLKWKANCPVPDHGDTQQKLSISPATKGEGRLRFVWTCHAGCTGEAVKKALLDRKIPNSCIPWSGVPKGIHAESTRKPDPDLGGILDKLLCEQPNPVDFVIEVGMRVWGVDDRTAATRAGISQATFYRHRARSKR